MAGRAEQVRTAGAGASDLARYRDALDWLPDPMVIFEPRRDATGRVVDLEYRFINRAALRLYGKQWDAVVGHTQLELFPSVADGELWKRYLAVLDGGAPESVAVRGFDENGVAGDFDVNAAPLHDGLIVTARDVTDRVRLERRLLYERDVNKATLEVAGALIVIVDFDWHILRFNRYCEQVTGYTEAEVLGRSAEMLIPEPERAEVLGKVALTTPGQPVEQVNHWQAKDGSLRLIRWSNAAVADESGMRMIAIGVDITDQARAEEELVARAHELEAANARLATSNSALEQFAYTASHDLSEPLRAIALPIKTVLAKYRDRPLDDRAVEFLGLALDGAERMRAMLDQLLSFSRVGRGDNPARPVDVGRVVKDVLANLSTLTFRTQASVVTDEPLPVVQGQHDELISVFQNLLSNSIKFVPKGARPQVHIAADPDGAMWRFTITDNGIGIPAKDRDRAFAMFRRLQAQDRYPGSGIGLATVKKIIEAHGGRIGIEDAPTGRGCRVWFTLPAA